VRTTGVRVLAAARNFSLLHRVLTASEAHQVSYPMGTGGSFLGDKRPGREADYSPHVVLRLRMSRAVPPRTMF
jgi:hypothetical protein